MSGIVEQVREGLEAKVEGLTVALQYVRDPREIDRLRGELLGAEEALDRLNKPDDRSEEEIQRVADMVNCEAEVDVVSWSSLGAKDKLKYQMELYFDRLKESLEESSKQEFEVSQVVDFLSKIDFVSCPYMEPIYRQMLCTLSELRYSVKSINKQIALKDAAFAAVDSSYSDLELINRFLNNPMSLPSLSEEKSHELEELRKDANQKEGC